MCKYELTAFAYNKRGRLLAVGKNSYERTHPLQYFFGCKVGRPFGFIHAELDALLKAREPVYRLLVVRTGKRGQPLLAKPCKACQLIIKHFDVKIVEHT